MVKQRFYKISACLFHNSLMHNTYTMRDSLIAEKLHELADIIRILIYKEDASLLTKVDLEDDAIFTEPLLMAYFNRAQTGVAFPDGMLPELLQGYLTEKPTYNVNAICNENGIGYLPTVGYFKKGETTAFEAPYIIPETNIEVIKYKVPLLRNILGIVTINNPIQDEELRIGEELFHQNITPLSNAILHLQKSLPDYFAIIQQCFKKCMLYQLKERYGISFASINANGCIFLIIPSGKEKEDEIYFINELGNLTGKIMHTSLFHNQKEMFKIDHKTRTSEIIEGEEDRRNIYTLFNNLFMSVSAMICLESCINASNFTAAQQHDAKARMTLFLKKYEVDIQKLEAFITHFGGLDAVFVQDGIDVYNFMIKNAASIQKKYPTILAEYDFTGFSYRMHYADFSARNS